MNAQNLVVIRGHHGHKTLNLAKGGGSIIFDRILIMDRDAVIRKTADFLQGHLEPFGVADRPHFVISDPDRARENLGKEELKIHHLQRVVFLRMIIPSKTRHSKEIMKDPAILTGHRAKDDFGANTTISGVIMTLKIAGVLE